jgi:hypothetical protein
MTAVEEWTLEQLFADGDSRVDCALWLCSLLVSSWHSCTERGVDKLFTADDSCVGMEVRKAACSLRQQGV